MPLAGPGPIPNGQPVDEEAKVGKDWKSGKITLKVCGTHHHSLVAVVSAF
jgi:hypothetical protein